MKNAKIGQQIGWHNASKGQNEECQKMTIFDQNLNPKNN